MWNFRILTNKMSSETYVQTSIGAQIPSLEYRIMLLSHWTAFLFFAFLLSIVLGLHLLEKAPVKWKIEAHRVPWPISRSNPGVIAILSRYKCGDNYPSSFSFFVPNAIQTYLSMLTFIKYYIAYITYNNSEGFIDFSLGSKKHNNPWFKSIFLFIEFFFTLSSSFILKTARSYQYP